METWIRELLERQAATQRLDARLPWPDKLKIAIEMRKDLDSLRSARIQPESVQ